MGLYMTQFSYTAEAWKALVKEPEDRAAVFAEHAGKLGGRMHALYYCMGEYDGVVIYEAPDEETAAAIVFTAVSPGHLKETKTTPLMTVEQTMRAMEKARGEAYPGPKLWSPLPS
ncbi:MAG: GYD domain-containing protein [Actinomycetota bacterium]